MNNSHAALALGALLCLAAAPVSAQTKGSAEHIKAATARVDGTFMRANAAKTADWPSYGLDYAETRFSKLDQINTGNVKDLGLAWSYNLESTRGVEATPLVVDGIMYVTASWSVVHAIDVRTGKKIWSFDPKVDKSKGYKGCCDVVNRGVALHQGKVFVGAYDGRLIALDAASGQPLWEKDTVIDKSKPYTITGAPRVFKGKVVIGNGGAEYGVRGYITAYDAATGEQKWRWFTVPGDPSKPFEDASMAKAAKTWDPSGKYWETGRRRHCLGHARLRSRAQPDVRGHRQRLAVGAQQAQPEGRRQPVPGLDRRAQPRHRQIRVALPGDARRQLGLHLDPADDAGRPEDRRQGRAR